MKEQLIDFLTEETYSEPIYGIVVGKLFTINAEGIPFVDFKQNASSLPIAARSTVAIIKGHIGSEVTIMFEEGDAAKPIISGLIQSPENRPDTQIDHQNISATVDRQRVVFDAKKEIVLRCGKASITLTRAGKILIRGKYVLSRSSGVNRIKGGSVQIN